jgi:hypothetical protein
LFTKRRRSYPTIQIAADRYAAGQLLRDGESMRLRSRSCRVGNVNSSSATVLFPLRLRKIDAILAKLKRSRREATSPSVPFFSRGSGIDHVIDLLCRQLSRAGPAARLAGWRLASALVLSPSSTRRRNASDRLVSFAVAQASTCTISSVGIREVTWGSRPVAGRPRLFFGVTFIDFFMIFGVTENRAEGKLSLPPRALTRATKDTNPNDPG